MTSFGVELDQEEEGEGFNEMYQGAERRNGGGSCSVN